MVYVYEMTISSETLKFSFVNEKIKREAAKHESKLHFRINDGAIGVSLK